MCSTDHTGIFPALVERPEQDSPEYSQAACQLGSTRVHVGDNTNSLFYLITENANFKYWVLQGTIPVDDLEFKL